MSGRQLQQVLAENRRKEQQLRSLQASMAELTRQYWSKWIEIADPAPDQRCGTAMTPVVITKASTMFKLVAGDVEMAERMAKREGIPFEVCLKAVADINEINTPSYLGGAMIEKGSNMKKQAKQQANQVAGLADIVVRHRMDGRDPELDLAVFKILRAASGQAAGSGRVVNSVADLLNGGR